MHCPGGNDTDPIWRVLTSSDGISSWTPLKPQHSKPNPLANQLWCIDFLTPPSSLLIIPYRLPAFLESLMSLKTDARFMQDGWKAVWSIPYISVAFFASLKQNFIAYRSSKVSSCPDCIFEIHQLWQSGFSRVYSNCCCSCSFEPEIIKISRSSHNMYSNNSEFSRVYDNFKCMYKKSLEAYWMHHIYTDSKFSFKHISSKCFFQFSFFFITFPFCEWMFWNKLPNVNSFLWTICSWWRIV